MSCQYRVAAAQTELRGAVRRKTRRADRRSAERREICWGREAQAQGLTVRYLASCFGTRSFIPSSREHTCAALLSTRTDCRVSLWRALRSHLARTWVTSRDQPVRKGPTRSTADNAHAGQIKKGTIVEVQVCDLRPTSSRPCNSQRWLTSERT